MLYAVGGEEAASALENLSTMEGKYNGATGKFGYSNRWTDLFRGQQTKRSTNSSKAVGRTRNRSHDKLYVGEPERNGGRTVSESDRDSKSESSELKFSVETNDAAYMKAVENGDTKTTQKMVDEAAKNAGYTEKMYHGSKRGGRFAAFRDWSYFDKLRVKVRVF